MNLYLFLKKIMRFILVKNKTRKLKNDMEQRNTLLYILSNVIIYYPKSYYIFSNEKNRLGDILKSLLHKYKNK